MKKIYYLIAFCCFLFLTGLRFGSVNLAHDASKALKEQGSSSQQDIYNGFVREVIASRDTGSKIVGFLNAMDIDPNGNLHISHESGADLEHAVRGRGHQRRQVRRGDPLPDPAVGPGLSA